MRVPGGRARPFRPDRHEQLGRRQHEPAREPARRRPREEAEPAELAHAHPDRVPDRGAAACRIRAGRPQPERDEPDAHDAVPGGRHGEVPLVEGAGYSGRQHEDARDLHQDGQPIRHVLGVAWCLKSARQFDQLGLFCLGRGYQFGIGVGQDRKQAVKLFERAEDQGDGPAKFFARWLRIKENCVGYRNEWERERFLFICTEPTGTVFAGSHQRNMWLSQERNKMERDPPTLRGLLR